MMILRLVSGISEVKAIVRRIASLKITNQCIIQASVAPSPMRGLL